MGPGKAVKGGSRWRRRGRQLRGRLRAAGPGTEPMMLSLQGIQTDLLCWPARSSRPSSRRLLPESVVALSSPGAALGVYCGTSRSASPHSQNAAVSPVPSSTWHKVGPTPHDWAGDQHMALLLGALGRPPQDRASDTSQPHLLPWSH